MASSSDQSTLLKKVIENIDNEMEIVLEKQTEIEWDKSLKDMPAFTIKEIELHRQNSGKSEASIIKTLDRGRKFKNERYLSADSIYTGVIGLDFVAKAKCKASMKKEKRDVTVFVNRVTGTVSNATCSCPAGNSSYCNHVMALLLELADYSLNQLTSVPEEISCTSRLRQWGVPGDNTTIKAPVMDTVLQKQTSSKGIRCTLYDPRMGQRDTLKNIRDNLQSGFQKIDKRIGFAHCILDDETLGKVNTRFGEFLVGSPLSYQLSPVEPTTKILTNITKKDSLNLSTHDCQYLPLRFITKYHDIVPGDWQLSAEQCEYFDTIKVSKADVVDIEHDTISQVHSEKWAEYRKHRITSSNAHKILIRKRNFESLLDVFLNPKSESDLPTATREALKYGRTYEPIARTKYIDVMKYCFNRDIDVRETGIVIQPSLFWLAASPDGLVSDKSDDIGFGLIEIKCTKSKKNVYELVNDPTFYVELINDKPVLKRDHPNGYFSQIQMAMGLAGVEYCDFIVFTGNGLIITRTDLDVDYFTELIKSLNKFYRDYMLPAILRNRSKHTEV